MSTQVHQQTKPLRNTEEILRDLYSTTSIGVAAYDEVERQNEVLRRANEEVAEMHDNLNIAERSLENIDSFWNRIVNYFSSDNSTEHRDATARYQKKFDAQADQKRKEIFSSPKQTTQFPTLPHLTNKTNAATLEKIRYMEEQDQDLDQILNLLGDLNVTARGLSQSLDEGNDTLNRLNRGTNLAQERVEKNTKFADYLMR